MLRTVALAVVLLALGACAERPVPLPAAVVGDAGAGAELFARPLLSGNGTPGCATCHSLDPVTRLVGPSLAGVAERAAASGSAADYLHSAIVTPDASVTPGYPAGSMYQHYASDLTAQQIADLVAFLLTLE